MILDRISHFRPQSILDVGCGCGSFTLQMANELEKHEISALITAADINESHLEKAARDNPHPFINYLPMDGSTLNFADQSFDAVICRYTLHHIPEWQKALADMARISRKILLIEEPVDEIRYPEKAFFMEAQNFLVPMQIEAGFYHRPHFKARFLLENLENIFGKNSFAFEIHQKDEHSDFEEFFQTWGSFASKTQRPEYWEKEMEYFRSTHQLQDIISADCFYAEIPAR
ncbi:MAG: hypothetical protein CVV64_17290 [Candidatus Wallbacteria bacterium HGW-Wallbacteria-1]|jgi:ubiquinone/menaquinone biosynthesis C-methylase UbiE|uniref:Methyltransferase type 11 domain-containing protein n=1 Tax=Candidatus Wallbacteria bacterium HGW-Wallbacteria-1 TaxID=2013854 RepID=A0A2N1PK99_9BACT|nr:MAG: hypothetical protein CVV64_17290 [Candidatus Wallbacteria bacterium HGW-Wallbacteria-1]